MNKLKALFFFTVLAVLASCVTINVYFPSAAAEKAAERFVGDVLGETGDDSLLFDPLDRSREVIYLSLIHI